MDTGRFFALTLDLLCIADFDGYFKHLNPVWEKTLGFTPAELLARPFIDFVHPDDRNATAAETRKLISGAVVVTFENRYRCKDGSYKWLLWNAIAVAEEKLIYAAARDITDRKQAEAELRESAARYRSLFERVPLGVYRTTPAGDILEANPAFIEMLSYPDRESLLATNAVDLYVDPAERSRWQEVVEHAMVPVYRFETRLRRRDGTIIWGQETTRIVRDDNGKTLYYEGIWEDVTQQKLAREELSKVSSAVQQTADPVIITSVDGTIEFVNAAFEKVTGFNAEEAIGKTARILKSGTHPQEFYEHLWETILAGRPWYGTLVNRKKDGNLYFAESSIAPIFSSPGRITHFVSVERDITERKQAENALQEYKEREWRAAQETEVARQVQVRLLPRTAPALETLEYAGACTQARAVGGDYYDFLKLGPGRVGLVLADVSGKGLSRALLMAGLRSDLHSQCHLALRDLPQMLGLVNGLFYESTDAETYASLFFGDYEDVSRRLRYANCGHWPPRLMRMDGTVEQLKSTCPVLGFIADWECSVAEVQLAPGDILVFFTDGVQEAANEAGEEFGVGRLIETVRANRHLPISALVSLVAATVQTFSSGKQEDDQTMILARVR